MVHSSRTRNAERQTIKVPQLTGAFMVLILGAVCARADLPATPVGGAPMANMNRLSALQVANLVRFGKVWGFLKYHHPSIARGAVDWDREFFEVLPSVVDARSSNEASAKLAAWVARTGAPLECVVCVKLDSENLQLSPPVDWIRDSAALGKPLRDSLVAIYRNRPVGSRRYVSLTERVGNPRFDDENEYDDQKFPDAAHQLLALMRYWNVVNYWYPYRDVIGGAWEKVLRGNIAAFATAGTRVEYEKALAALVASTNDSHGAAFSIGAVRPPDGQCQIPAQIRFLDRRPFVFRTFDADGPELRLGLGDEIVSVNSIPVSDIVEQWSPYYPASNEAARLRDIARNLTRGPCSAVRLGVRRGNAVANLELQRHPLDPELSAQIRKQDFPGETFRLLVPELAYLKVSDAKASKIAEYIEGSRGTTALIVDLRAYPSQFVVFELAGRMVTQETPFARFLVADLDNPGAFTWKPAITLFPRKPHYDGKVLVLVDEATQSQGEYLAMALRASPQVRIVGSSTAGADGNVSSVALPGGYRVAFSGIGVFYPDKRRTQRVGIIPDVVVRPTIKGISDGVDEVLLAAIRDALGDSIMLEDARRLATVMSATSQPTPPLGARPLGTHPKSAGHRWQR